MRKVILITGTSSGFGKSIAEKLHSQGYTVIGTSRNSDKINSVFKTMKLDINNYEMSKNLVDNIIGSYGKIDILINNAGLNVDNLSLRMKDDEWDNVIDVHLNGQYLLIKSFIKKMVKNRWGRIINISSTSAVLGNKGQANYAAAKAGIEAMSRSLARELGSRNINVNCVAPGFIETDMTKEISDGNEDFLASQIPLGRLGKPNEIAEVVNFLASDQANYITGQTIHVNGGLYM